MSSNESTVGEAFYRELRRETPTLESTTVSFCWEERLIGETQNAPTLLNQQGICAIDDIIYVFGGKWLNNDELARVKLA